MVLLSQNAEKLKQATLSKIKVAMTFKSGLVTVFNWVIQTFSNSFWNGYYRFSSKYHGRTKAIHAVLHTSRFVWVGFSEPKLIKNNCNPIQAQQSWLISKRTLSTTKDKF